MLAVGVPVESRELRRQLTWTGNLELFWFDNELASQYENIWANQSVFV
jgi:hypothetical protein